MLEILGKKEELFVDWNIHDVCNYTCHYCQSNRGVDPFPDLDNVSRTLDQIVEVYGSKLITFQISGGEPTVWKDLPKFLDIIFHKTKGNCKVEIVTNGSPGPSYWKKLKPELYVYFSLHYLEFDGLDQFIASVAAYRSEHKKILLIMIPEYFDKVVEYHSILKKELPGVIITCKPLDTRYKLAADRKSLEYTQEQRDTMRRLNDEYVNLYLSKYANSSPPVQSVDSSGQVKLLQPFNLVINNQNNFVGWECDIGLEKLCLQFNGDIRGGSCGSAKKIEGNWRTGEKINFPATPTTCKSSNCFCISDIMVSKRKK